MSAHNAPSLPSRRNRSRIRAIRHNLLIRWVDARFIHRPRTYLVQALLAAAILVAILVAEDALTNGAIVAAVASSVAVVFFAPHSVASNPGRIIGGHISGVVAGFCTVGIMLLLPDSVAANQWVLHALQGASLALVILFMTITITEHTRPPASGTRSLR